MTHSGFEPDLSVNIGGVIFKNPVFTASGTFGYGAEFSSFLDLNHLGGIIVKGLSLEPSKGNPPPRIVETSGGMLNAIGLENVGIECFEKEKLPFLKSLSTPVIVNIFGKTIEDYAKLAARIETIPGIAMIEVNISCPNVSAGGLAFGTDPQIAHDVVRSVKEKTTKPVMVKLSPNVTDITVIAKKVEEAGADALSLINTLTGMAVDLETRRPKLANITGGLSGPAIKPVALRMVWQVCRAVSIPVVGIGGIMTATDALEFLITGAKSVQVGTANFINPRATMDIVEGITDYMKKKEIKKITDIIGTLEV
ncbi:MAG: dihydroorotate dehydrogenase [Desulfobacteraceae bacterium]|nr:dihydroorotate dehydrogenase [Desulfobacteraceae bacterium]MBU4002573.1 dihydroorotate dehydrogenase [Pseudomonadota bacterium]